MNLQQAEVHQIMNYHRLPNPVIKASAQYRSLESGEFYFKKTFHSNNFFHLNLRPLTSLPFGILTIATWYPKLSRVQIVIPDKSFK